MEAQRNSLKKPPSRRRSHTRRSIAQASVINLAEARREIAHALLLHRFSLSSKPPTISTTITTTTTSVGVAPACPWMLGNSYTYTINPNLAYSCYSVVEDMPLHAPEPVWSTTAPSLPAAPPGLDEAMEFLQWGESQAEAAASTWWFAFLEALDGNIQTTNSHFVDHNSTEQQRHISKMGDPTNAPDRNNASLDEWLVHLIKQEDDSI